MSRATETGESTAAINARADARAWDVVLPLMAAGAELTRPSAKLPSYYVDGRGGISPAGIRRLERQGLIEAVGVDRYRLCPAQPAPEPATTEGRLF